MNKLQKYLKIQKLRQELVETEIRKMEIYKEIAELEPQGYAGSSGPSVSPSRNPNVSPDKNYFGRPA